MLPILIVGGAVAASFAAVRAAATALLGVEILEGRVAKKEAERNYRNDDNPVRENQRMARQEELAKKGIKTGDDLTYIDLPESMLPEWQKERAGQYLFREREYHEFLLALRNEQLLHGGGEAAEDVSDFCARHNIPLSEMSDVVTHLWNYDFTWAKSVSESRMQDPRWRAVARKNDIVLREKN